MGKFAIFIHLFLFVLSEGKGIGPQSQKDCDLGGIFYGKVGPSMTFVNKLVRSDTTYLKDLEYSYCIENNNDPKVKLTNEKAKLECEKRWRELCSEEAMKVAYAIVYNRDICRLMKKKEKGDEEHCRMITLYKNIVNVGRPKEWGGPEDQNGTSWFYDIASENNPGGIENKKFEAAFRCCSKFKNL